MSEEMSLQDVFDGEKPIPAEEPVEVKQEEPEAEGDKQEEVETTEQPKPDEPPSSENNPYFKAMMDERTKRQERDARIEAMERQLKELQEKKEDEPAPDFYDNPDAAFEHHQSKLEQRLTQKMISMSEEMVRAQYEDYDAVIDQFAEAVKTNPVLLEEARQSANPALKAYQLGKKQAKLAEIGDPEDFAKRTEESIRAKVEKELREKLAAEKQKSTEAKSRVVPSLANENTSGDSEVYIEPSFDDVFKKDY